MDHSRNGAIAPTPRPPARRPIKQTSLRYQRGDIWFVVEDPDKMSVGTEIWPNRPGLIVSNNISANRSGFVQVVYLTTSANKRSTPTHIPVGNPLDPDKMSMALCEQIHTVDVSRLSRRLGSIDPRYLGEIDTGLVYALSIGHRDDYALFKKWESHIKEHGIDLSQEIQALSSLTTDARVESLTRALTIVASERDSLRQILESREQLPSVLAELRTAITKEST